MKETIVEVTDRLNRYEPHTATASVSRFVDHLSNWYLRRSRGRFWAKAGSNEETDADKNAAYATLYSVLTHLSGCLPRSCRL